MGRGRALAALTAVLLLGFALRTALLTEDRFHADEALYAGWALRMYDGDPLLTGVPVDKPPLHLYVLAASASIWGPGELAFRLPSLAASTLGIALAYALGRRLYGRAGGTWAALWVALSPFDILFARTAFTDPLLVLWAVSAIWAAATNRWFAAGICAGLAFATKQHAVLLIPLAIVVGLVQGEAGQWRGRDWARAASSIAGFALPYALVVAWDSARWAIRPGYWAQSALSYGGLPWAAPAAWGERLVEWLSWARYLVPSPALIALLLAGTAALLIGGWRRGWGREARLDAVWAAYAVAYLGAHTLLGFSIWDRYLLPLALPVAMLLARSAVRLIAWAADLPFFARRRRTTSLLLATLICAAAALPAWRAAENSYPIGGEHWAYQGLDQVCAYLKANAPPDAVLYHHWLRWHYEYYLRGTRFELRWWESGEHLRREAARTPPGRAQYIVLPDWRTLEPDAPGVRLEPVFAAHRQDGSISMRVYRVWVDP